MNPNRPRFKRELQPAEQSLVRNLYLILLRANKVSVPNPDDYYDSATSSIAHERYKSGYFWDMIESLLPRLREACLTIDADAYNLLLALSSADTAHLPLAGREAITATQEFKSPVTVAESVIVPERIPESINKLVKSPSLLSGFRNNTNTPELLQCLLVLFSYSTNRLLPPSFFES